MSKRKLENATVQAGSICGWRRQAEREDQLSGFQKERLLFLSVQQP